MTRFFRFIALLLVTYPLLPLASLRAQTPDRMFDDLNVRQLVEKEVVEEQPLEYRFFPKVQKTAPEEPKKDQPPKKRQDIVMTYGNPKERHPVLAVDDAPAPFKGMQAALEAGEKELAYEYAQQWVRYMGDIQERNKDIMKLFSHGMRKEGLATQGDWTHSPMFLDPFLMEIDEKDEAKRSEERIDVQRSGFSPNRSIREELKGRGIIADPKGEVDIFYFFDPKIKESLEMGKDLNRLYKLYENNPRVNVIGMSTADISAEQAEAIRKKMSFDFPVNRRGELLAKSLGLSGAPATVFMSRNGSPAVFEEGRKSFEYVREITEMLRGN